MLSRDELRERFDGSSDPPAWAPQRIAPSGCRGGGWVESELDNFSPTSPGSADRRSFVESLEEDEMPKIGFPACSAIAAADASIGLADCFAAAQPQHCHQSRPDVRTTAVHSNCVDSCAEGAATPASGSCKALLVARVPPHMRETAAYTQMREAHSGDVAEERLSWVLPREAVPSGPQAPDSSAPESTWAQGAVVISVGAVSAGAFASAAGGVLPVAVAAGSMGFTLGLLSSILGIRVGRWVS